MNPQELTQYDFRPGEKKVNESVVIGVTNQHTSKTQRPQSIVIPNSTAPSIQGNINQTHPSQAGYNQVPPQHVSHVPTQLPQQVQTQR